MAFETGGHLDILLPSGVLRALPKTQGGASPHLMPDGRGVLYANEQSGSKLYYYDFKADTAVLLLNDASEGQYLETGHIVYGSILSGLYAIRFDPAKRAVEGTPIPVVLDVQANGRVTPFAISASGTLVYRAGAEPESRIAVRDPSGRIDTLPLAPKTLSYVRFSPDGKQLALTVGSARGTNRHTALFDFARGTLTRFTLEGGGHSPMWSPDGTRLAFTMEGPTTDAEDMAVQPVDGSQPPVLMPRMPNDQHATAWPNETTLVFSNNSAPRTLGGALGGGITGLLNPVTGGKPRIYLSAVWGEFEATVSPDGQVERDHNRRASAAMVRRWAHAVFHQWRPNRSAGGGGPAGRGVHGGPCADDHERQGDRARVGCGSHERAHCRDGARDAGRGSHGGDPALARVVQAESRADGSGEVSDDEQIPRSARHRVPHLRSCSTVSPVIH